MPKFETFGEFVRVKFKTQANAAKLLKTKQNVISNWVTGRNNPEPEMQDLLRDKWGYDGGWPVKAKEAAAASAGSYLTLEAFADFPGRVKRLEDDSRAVLPLVQVVADLKRQVDELQKRLDKSE